MKFAENGKPVDNGLIESFNGRLRVDWFSTNSMYDAREKLELRRLDWDSRRTHSASGSLTPDEHAASQWPEVEHVRCNDYP